MHDYVMPARRMRQVMNRDDEPADDLFQREEFIPSNPVRPALKPMGSGDEAAAPERGLRYEDVVPARPPLTPLPQYNHLPEGEKRGFKNRLKGLGLGLLTGLASAGSADNPQQAVGLAIGRGVGGAVNPGAPREELFRMGPLARAREQRQAELQSRQFEDQQIDQDLARRERIARINHLSTDEWKFDPTTGLQYNKGTGSYRVPRDEQGQPIDPVRLRQAREQAENQRDMETLKQTGRQGLLTQQQDFTQRLKQHEWDWRGGENQKNREAAMGRAKLTAGEAMRRTAYTQSETNKRAAATEAGRRSRARLNPMDGGTARATPENIGQLMQHAPPRLAERLRGLTPQQQAAQWNQYYGLF